MIKVENYHNIITEVDMVFSSIFFHSLLMVSHGFFFKGLWNLLLAKIILLGPNWQTDVWLLS